jgi:hypothetical protein
MLTNFKKLQQMCQKPDAGCRSRLEELRLGTRRYGYQLQLISLALLGACMPQEARRTSIYFFELYLACFGAVKSKLKIT